MVLPSGGDFANTNGTPVLLNGSVEYVRFGFDEADKPGERFIFIQPQKNDLYEACRKGALDGNRRTDRG